MIDNNVRAMVRAVHGGDLEAAVPLLDRLHELGDQRWFALYNALGNLHAMATSRMPERRSRRMTEEEIIFRRDESNFQAWLTFSNGLKVIFWAEFKDDNLATMISCAGKLVNVARQAKRIARNADDDTIEEGMPGDMPPDVDIGYSMMPPPNHTRGW